MADDPKDPSEARPPTAPAGDVYLDFEGVRDAVAELGFPKPERVTVVGWADRKVLPFFKGLDGVRYISKRTIVEFFRKRQEEAVWKKLAREARPAAGIAPQRRRGRPPKCRV
ncbi:hypothetical protein [Azospirillum sp.]|uniref:hypothetical protein n=1 Tax=Azospirillum sp. TaxID=34012 RepID=UPI002D4D03C2|nr:hypothetical protein [Azospirillum sp.]HYD65731.1 hypothetical protein [Azospirillum sp.]